MKKQRPINLDLTTIQFPITAIASILHRISGIITFFSLGVLLWLLGLSLSSQEGFIQVVYIFNMPLVKLVIWGMLSALIYHILSGVRHLCMDFGWVKETFAAGILTARVIMLLTTVFSILVGVWLW